MNVFSRRWIIFSVIAILTAVVMVRLGIWQLDRLDQRRAFNQRVFEQLEAEPIDLGEINNYSELTTLEYRGIRVKGEYDFDHEVAIRNQAWDGELGVHLLTPLKINDRDEYVLVNRGWVPQADFMAGNLQRFSEPGVVEINGLIRLTETSSGIGRVSDPEPVNGQFAKAWNMINIDRLAQQMPYNLVPIYIQQSPDPTWVNMPYRSEPSLDLTEGPHLGYAMQWFTFALITLVGYVVMIAREIKKKKEFSMKDVTTYAKSSTI